MMKDTWFEPPAEWFAEDHLDACPECMSRDQRPTATEYDVSGACTCDYVCSDCGREWTTGWNA